MTSQYMISKELRDKLLAMSQERMLDVLIDAINNSKYYDNAQEVIESQVDYYKQYPEED